MNGNKKATFQFGHETYEAFTNGKEYGAKKLVYLNVTRVGGTNTKKASYSKANEAFDGYQAGDLEMMRLAAQALGIY